MLSLFTFNFIKLECTSTGSKKNTQKVSKKFNFISEKLLLLLKEN